MDKRDEKFSAGFYRNECSFRVIGVPEENGTGPQPISVSVAEKMLQRGLSTKPSAYKKIV